MRQFHAIRHNGGLRIVHRTPAEQPMHAPHDVTVLDIDADEAATMTHEDQRVTVEETSSVAPVEPVEPDAPPATTEPPAGGQGQ